MDLSRNLIESNFKCEICEKIFHNNKSIRKHIKSAHGEAKSFTCNVCNRKVETRNALDHHLKNCHEEGQKNYKCDSCGKSFKQSGYLKIHIKTIHEGQKNYKCNFCGLSFRDSGHLKKHIKTIHQGQKNYYKCDS